MGFCQPRLEAASKAAFRPLKASLGDDYYCVKD